jgi:predicted permease
MSLPDLDDLQESAGAFSTLSGFSALTYTLSAPGDPRRVEGLRVGRRFAEVLGIAPFVGRSFGDRDFDAGSHVVLISPGMWRREFGGSRTAVGGSVVLDDVRHTIVGVLPDLPIADITAPHDFWVPLVARPGAAWEPVRGNGFISVLARIAPGINASAAQSQLSGITRELSTRYPASNGTKPAVTLRRVHEAMVAPVRQALVLIFLSVAAVLLVACANLTNLLLAHAERRRHEFSVRLAMGAERHRLRAQILLEMGAIVAVSALAAAAIAPALAQLFLRMYPDSVPRSTDVAFTVPMTAAAVALSALVVMALALPQVRRLRSVPVNTGAVRAMTGSRQDRRGRATLIAVQVAFTIVLAFCGVALVRSMARLSAVAPGFTPAGVIALSVSPSPARFGSGAATRAFFEQLLQEIRNVPGVRSAAVSTAVPFISRGWRFSIPSPDGKREPTLVSVTIASPGYFETLGVTVRRGRLMTDAEHAGNQRLIVLNEAAARLLPHADPVGRTLRYSGSEWTIVGIVASTRQSGLGEPPSPELFLPWSQAGRAPQRLLARIDGDPAAVLPLIRARTRTVDPAAPIADVAWLDERVERSVAADRFRATLLACLAAIGLVLAVLGVWSVTSYVVARQGRENGIRAALGETGGQLVGRMLMGVLRPALVGAIAGLVASLWAAPLLETFLFEVRARDPITLVTACTAVLTSALLAAVIPARRAVRAESGSALRAE